jgi:hypothetical protein
MNAPVVIDFEGYVQPGQCLDDCTIAAVQPYFDDMGCQFSLAGLKDVSRSILSHLFFRPLFTVHEFAPVPHPIQQQKNVEPCLDDDKRLNEDSEGGLEGCTSGSNFGNPCEVIFLCTSHHVV